MDTNDESVKKALDDLFDDNKQEDIITIDNIDNISSDNSESILLDSLDEVETSESENKIQEDMEEKDEVVINPDEHVEINDEKVEEEVDLDKEVDRIIKENPEEPINNKKIILFIILGFILGFITIFLISNHMNNQEKSINCSYEIEDTGYKTTDEYKITYAGGKILKIYGIYKYKAKNEEFEKQIDYIKDEKIPVIINSNGMPGFTYLYEIGTDVIEIVCYLVFSDVDCNVID